MARVRSRVADRSPKLEVADDLEKEFTITAGMGCLVLGSPPQRNATEGKGTGMKSDLLPAGLTLFANKLNGIKLLQSPFGDTNGRQN
jgi:hypothetical protein